MKYTILLFSLIMSSFGCQTAETQKFQSLEFYVRYLQTEKTFRAEATFREASAGQNPVAAELPGGLKFEGKEMSVLPESGGKYKTEFDGDAQTEPLFVWENEKKQLQQFKMPMPAIGGFNFRFATKAEKLNRSRPARLVWSGEPIGENESFLLFWENEEHGVVKMPVSGMTADASLILPAVKISELKPGGWQLYIVRKKAVKTSVDGVEVKGLGEFYTKTETFLVE